MKHTVDSLMALAYKIRDARTYDWDVSEAVEAGNTLRTALTEALAQPIDTSQKRVEKSGEIKQIGCVQHDCAECKARAAQPVAQPIGYVTQGYFTMGDGRITESSTDAHVVPVYVEAQPVLEPAPQEQIQALLDDFMDSSDERLMQFARDVEKLHGIGGDK